MSIWSDIGKTAKSAALGGLGSAVSGGVTSLFNGLLGKGNSQKKQEEATIRAEKRQMEYWYDMFRTQRKAALDDYARQRTDTINDILNSKTREIQSLKAAGLSPSAAYADGSFNPATASADIKDSDGGSVGANMTGVDYHQNVTDMFMSQQNQLLDAQRKLMESQTRKTDADTEKTSTETEKLQYEIQNYLDTLPDLQKQIKNNALIAYWQAHNESNKFVSEYAKSQAEGKFWNEHGGEQLEAAFAQLQTQLQQSQFDLQKAKDLKPLEVQKLKADIEHTLADKDWIKSKDEQTKVVTYFNRLGIGITGDMIGSIAALATSGKGDVMADAVCTTITGLLKGLGTAIGNGIKSAFDDK